MLAVVVLTACGSGARTTSKELQRVRAGAVDIVLLSADDDLHTGKASCVLEFRNAGGGLVDVGDVRVNATMAMPGMGPMLAKAEVGPGDAAGRYAVTTEFTMNGTWRMDVQWSGGAGAPAGSASMSATVR